MIKFIEDKDAPKSKGVWIVIVFVAATFLSSLFRNQFYFYSYILSIKIRKTLTLAMYDKIGRLSMKSLI